MWIIKIGGSWLKNPNLKNLLFKIKKIRPQHTVIVTVEEFLQIQLEKFTKIQICLNH